MDFKSELIDKFNMIKVDVSETVKAGRSYMAIADNTHNAYVTFFTPEEDYLPSFSESTDLYMFPVDTSDLNPGSIVRDIDGDLLVLISGGYGDRFYAEVGNRYYAEVDNIKNIWSVDAISIVEILYRA